MRGKMPNAMSDFLLEKLKEEFLIDFKKHTISVCLLQPRTQPQAQPQFFRELNGLNSSIMFSRMPKYKKLSYVQPLS